MDVYEHEGASGGRADDSWKEMWREMIEKIRLAQEKLPPEKFRQLEMEIRALVIAVLSKN